MAAIHRHLRGVSAVAAAALLTAACVATGPSGSGGSAGSSGGTATGTAPTTASASVGNAIRGHSLTGEAISGDFFCSYYAPDGSFGRVFEGLPPEWGNWTASGDRVCESVDGITGCNRFQLQPGGQVILTNLDGSGAFQTMARLTRGNSCGV